jgi:hypothetical protein
MSSNAEIAERLHHFAVNIERWRAEAARLTLLVSQAREAKAPVEQLVALEETASEIYADVAAFRDTVEEVAQKSPAAAAELAGVGDALHLVLLEITELGIRFYKNTTARPDAVDALPPV